MDQDSDSGKVVTKCELVNNYKHGQKFNAQLAHKLYLFRVTGNTERKITS